jgi:hypothetical protein
LREFLTERADVLRLDEATLFGRYTAIETELRALKALVTNGAGTCEGSPFARVRTTTLNPKEQK